MILGIDPDLEKSGVAVLRDTNKIEYSTLNFVETLAFVRMNKSIIKCVYVEAGWLNKKSNWHGASNMSVAARVGKNVGENHATGKLLIECIEAEGLKVVPVKPSTKKLNSEDFERITKIKTRTNQEERDAILLVFGR